MSTQSVTVSGSGAASDDSGAQQTWLIKLYSWMTMLPFNGYQTPGDLTEQDQLGDGRFSNNTTHQGKEAASHLAIIAVYTGMNRNLFHNSIIQNAGAWTSTGS